MRMWGEGVRSRVTDWQDRGATTRNGPGPPQYPGFTITLRHTTIGRIALDEWSAWHIDIYLTTHNTHKEETFMPPAGFEPTIPSTRAAHAALDRAATGDFNNQLTVCPAWVHSISLNSYSVNKWISVIRIAYRNKCLRNINWNGCKPWTNVLFSSRKLWN